MLQTLHSHQNKKGLNTQISRYSNSGVLVNGYLQLYDHSQNRILQVLTIIPYIPYCPRWNSSYNMQSVRMVVAGFVVEALREEKPREGQDRLGDCLMGDCQVATLYHFYITYS